MDISPISYNFAAYPVNFSNQPSGEELVKPWLLQEDQDKSKTTATNEVKKDAKAQDGKELSPEEVKEVEKLKARDAEVRAHEMAHLAAAGGLAVSGANFTYERGPDGASYASGGEVKIDTSKGSNPEETLRRAQTIQTAALAPVEPSATDRKVAADAVRMETEARTELAELEATEAAKTVQEQEEAKEKKETEGKDQNKQANAADFPVSYPPLPPAIKQYQAIFQNQPAANGNFHLAV